MYLARAAHVYERWGARHKVALLREEFRELLAAAAAVSPADRTAGPDGLDLLSVVRSARALSEEIDLPRLLSRVLDLTLQTAGGRRGFLIVPAGEELMIAAAVDPDSDAPLPEPVSTSRRLARTVVNYVARSHEDMVLADASRDPRLQDDPWVRENRPRSLLCVPIRGRSQLLGLLYLDNDLSPGVFTPDRLQVVRILGAQAAISMENARLYEGLAREVETRTSELEIATQVAASERDNVDRLLRNILPGAVADELKSQGRVQPVRYDQASILFCDFVEFTRWASRIEPEALISDLDRVFLAFDDICARNHLEKIKTIGDAYMCAGGLPIRRRTHAVDTCLAALEMRALIERENTIPGGVPWRVRLGVHSGPVMAGVIGKSRFAYDVWGDAVNVASRLEATSEPGRINVSSDTACMVEPFFTLTPRGPADIRNRGEMEMFFLEEIRPELASNDNAFRARYTQMLRTPTT
jgi:class 3 adenylate cyclase